MLKPGHRIGQYEIQRVLGDGGMAIVYSARHVGMGTEHAVKVLLANLALNPKTVERFRQEARAQFRLRHANIVQVTDYVETDDAIALVMDLVQGMTLRAAMDKLPGPWPVEDVVAVMAPVLDAVAHAHRKGLDGAAVVHRDLKPENILLELCDDQSWPGTPKVADFGIAKVMGTANVGTRTNARLGTVPFMSPEQFRSAKDVDVRADVWALGMMLWQLLAGRLPVDPDDNIAVLKLYERLVPVPMLCDEVPGIPRALSDAVAQALSVQVAGRFADAWPLLRAVEGAIAVKRSMLPEGPSLLEEGSAPPREKSASRETGCVSEPPAWEPQATPVEPSTGSRHARQPLAHVPMLAVLPPNRPVRVVRVLLSTLGAIVGSVAMLFAIAAIANGDGGRGFLLFIIGITLFSPAHWYVRRRWHVGIAGRWRTAVAVASSVAFLASEPKLVRIVTKGPAVAVASSVAFLASFAARQPSEKLIGKWTIDVDKMGEMDEIKKMPEAEKKAALEMAKGMASSMTIEFTKEKMIVDAMGQKKEGPYKVKSEEGDKVVIEGTLDGKTETMNCEIKGDGLVMGDGQQTFPLKRK